jgi:hypothetical protein
MGRATVCAWATTLALLVPSSAFAGLFNMDFENFSTQPAQGAVVILGGTSFQVRSTINGGYFCSLASPSSCDFTMPVFASVASGPAGSPFVGDTQIAWVGAPTPVNPGQGEHLGWFTPNASPPVISMYWTDVAGNLLPTPGSVAYVVQSQVTFTVAPPTAAVNATTDPPSTIPANGSLSTTLPVQVMPGSSVVLRYTMLRPDGTIGAINFVESDPAVGTGPMIARVTFSNSFLAPSSGGTPAPVDLRLTNHQYAVVTTPIPLDQLGAQNASLSQQLVVWSVHTTSVPATSAPVMAVIAGLLLLAGLLVLRRARAGLRRSHG